MQGGLSPTDRKLMWGFAVLFVLLADRVVKIQEKQIGGQCAAGVTGIGRWNRGAVLLTRTKCGCARVINDRPAETLLILAEPTETPTEPSVTGLET